MHLLRGAVDGGGLQQGEQREEHRLDDERHLHVGEHTDDRRPHGAIDRSTDDRSTDDRSTDDRSAQTAAPTTRRPAPSPPTVAEVTAPADTTPPATKQPGPYLSYCWGGTAEKVDVFFVGKVANPSNPNGLTELHNQPGTGCTWPVPADSVTARVMEVVNATSSGWVACSFKIDGSDTKPEVDSLKAVCGAANI